MSVAHARYFVTCAAVRPERHLVQPRVARGIISHLEHLELDGDMDLLCGTVMPDHIHILLTLNDRLDLSQVIGKLKSQTRSLLSAAGARWQSNFFEHRVRPDEPLGDIARYIYLNPYRAHAVPPTAEWPWWVLGKSADFDFLHLLREGRYPPVEWISASLQDLGVAPEAVGHD